MPACHSFTRRLVAALAAVLPAAAAGASFAGLGDLPGGTLFSQALAIAGDGSVVVGHSDTGDGRTAFRWSSAQGMVSLGHLPGGAYSSATAVSNDGSVIAGSAVTNLPDGSVHRLEAFRWTAGQGMTIVGELGADMAASRAYDVSADGRVVVGWREDGGRTSAYRWSVDDGLTDLGALPVPGYASEALAISSAGDLVVGASGTARPEYKAILWGADPSPIDLGNLGNVAVSLGLAIDISGNSRFVVGRVNTNSGLQAFRWDADQGMIGLGDLPGGIFQSWALATSSDGSCIVGVAHSANGPEAFIWTAQYGIQSLRQVLIDQGLNLSDWILNDANDISNDGRTVVGSATNADGHIEAYVATLNIP